MTAVTGNGFARFSLDSRLSKTEVFLPSFLAIGHFFGLRNWQGAGNQRVLVLSDRPPQPDSSRSHPELLIKKVIYLYIYLLQYTLNISIAIFSVYLSLYLLQYTL